jgi:hypothetical protein
VVRHAFPLVSQGDPQMKTPDTTKAVSSATRQGAKILPFNLPARTNTACAEILARMLSGEVLTGMD